jgi:hypothetical protein
MDYIEDSFGLIRNLKLARFRLELKTTEKIVLPEHKGSTFRGVLGWLKKVICSNREIADRSQYRLQQADIHLFLAQLALDDGNKDLARAEAEITRERTFCGYKPTLELLINTCLF